MIRSVINTLVVTAIAAIVAACGGGETPEPLAHRFVAEMAAANAGPLKRGLAAGGTQRALAAATAPTPDAKTLFDWAEYKYPELFQPRGTQQNYSLQYLGVQYTVRSYPNGNNLGVTPTGDIYGLGPFTNDLLQGFGNAATYAAMVEADRCNVYPGSCNPPASGPYNECVDAAAETLPTGFRWNLAYTTSGSSSGEYTVDSLVDGPTSFLGTNAIQVSNNIAGSSLVAGYLSTYDGKSKTYIEKRSDGLLQTLGSDDEYSSGDIVVGTITIPGLTTISRTVFNPPDIGIEFTLQLGQSVTKTTTSTTTTSSPPGTAPATGSSTTTWTFEAKEAVTTSLGRTFDTCRYKTTTAGVVATFWFILGKGVTAKSESGSGAEFSRTELKSGTYNGAPL